jgi:hypothetical protein
LDIGQVAKAAVFPLPAEAGHHWQYVEQAIGNSPGLRFVAQAAAVVGDQRRYILASLLKRAFDFLVGFELRQGVNRPNGCRNPPDESQLQYQADDAGKRTANSEETEPGKYESKQ